MKTCSKNRRKKYQTLCTRKNGQTDRQIDRQMDRQTDRQTDRQIDNRHTDRQTEHNLRGINYASECTLDRGRYAYR